MQGNSSPLIELPGTSIKGIPLQTNGQRLGVGLVEIGCMPETKRAQLKDKRQYLRRLWQRTYGSLGISWDPRIRRTLVHYDPVSCRRGVFNKLKPYNPDVVIFYSHIPESALTDMTDVQKSDILKTAPIDLVDMLGELLQKSDAGGLHNLIMCGKNRVALGNLRGKLAETVVLNDFYANMDPGMRMYSNERIRFVGQKPGDHTEVDGIMIYYGDAPYWSMIGHLQGLDHRVVEVNWDLAKNN